MPVFHQAPRRGFMAACCLALAPVLFTCSAMARSLHGEVTHVSDGDTLWVRTARHAEPQKLRLASIDAPESCQAWGPQARDALATLVLHQTVQVRGSAHDEYGRLLAHVSVNGTDVEEWMVLHGHAWSYSYGRRKGRYAAQQAQAQSARRGLWASAAMEPRQFRKSHGACPH